jgi:hypothetical protein
MFEGPTPAPPTKAVHNSMTKLPPSKQPKRSAGAFGPHRAFRSHFGAPAAHQQRRPAAAAQQQQRASAAEQQRGAVLGLLQLLPVLLLVFMTLFSGSQDPAFALQVGRDLAWWD